MKRDSKSLQLFDAIEKSDIPAALELISDPEVDVNIQTYGGSTPLHKVCDLPIAKALLQHPKINLHQQDHEGYTPLHKLAAEDNTDVVRLVLKQKV